MKIYTDLPTDIPSSIHAVSVDLEIRFWAKVKKGEDNKCWEWKACRQKFGYGVIGTAGNKTELAHRVSWELHFGHIPRGLCVLHKCDNPGCVNPRHLFLGTRQDNNKDRDEKRRLVGPLGESNRSAVLVEKEVLAIRRGYSPRTISTRRGLAIQFGVSIHTIEDIVYRSSWKHLP